MKALEMGAVETLILWENLDVMRVTLKEREGDETLVRGCGYGGQCGGCGGCV